MPRIKADTIAEHRENQRARLLEAARHILITDGAVAVTPGAVAQAAGISRPAVYQYFENGTALIEHVVLDDFEDSLEAIEAAVDAAADPHTRALAYVENVIRQAASGMHLTATALSGYTMPDTFNREIAELHKKQIGPFVGALRELGVTDHIEFALLGGIVETGVKLAESNVPVEPIIDGICRQLDAALARHRNADHHN
jgi:AcrR family transcriptional regulator